MKRLATIVASLTIAGGCCRPAEPVKSMSPSPVIAQPADRFTGILRGGIIAIGAETTGWALETQPGKRVDIDVSKVADRVAALDGKRVVVTGTMTTANWIESGEKPLLIADQIEPANPAE